MNNKIWKLRTWHDIKNFEVGSWNCMAGKHHKQNDISWETFWAIQQLSMRPIIWNTILTIYTNNWDSKFWWNGLVGATCSIWEKGTQPFQIWDNKGQN